MPAAERISVNARISGSVVRHQLNISVLTDDLTLDDPHEAPVIVATSLLLPCASGRYAASANLVQEQPSRGTRSLNFLSSSLLGCEP
jgi:hypothetical protein